MNLIALQIKTSTNFKENLIHLKELINSCEEDSLILAPELALSGFSYDRMIEASNFSLKAIEDIKALSFNKIIALTFITKKEDNFFNTLHIFHNKEIVHTQSKMQLFPLGNELEHFSAGNEKDMKIIEINGIKIATLICFELRFPRLWEKVKGADIILNPAMWGLKRKDHYESIAKALALVNQCFVIACNSADENMAKGSAIISSFGNIVRDDSSEIIKVKFDLDEIKKTRKYIDIGLN
jgi:omega-amidase